MLATECGNPARELNANDVQDKVSVLHKDISNIHSRLSDIRASLIGQVVGMPSQDKKEVAQPAGLIPSVHHELIQISYVIGDCKVKLVDIERALVLEPTKE